MKISSRIVVGLTGFTLSMITLMPSAWSESSPKDRDDKTEASTSPVVVPVEVFNVETIVFQVIEKSSEVVTFPAGKATLSTEEAGKLTAFVANMKALAPVERFTVATWSDKEYPAKGKSLGKADIKLAKYRNEAIKVSLDAAGAKDVEYFTMTARPNWFQRYLSTETAELKGSAKTKFLTNEAMERMGEKLRARGGPSKSVIVAVFEKNHVSH